MLSSVLLASAAQERIIELQEELDETKDALKETEESLKLFEEGTTLARFCNKTLDEAELKITKLNSGEAEA